MLVEGAQCAIGAGGVVVFWGGETVVDPEQMAMADGGKKRAKEAMPVVAKFRAVADGVVGVSQMRGDGFLVNGAEDFDEVVVLGRDVDFLPIGLAALDSAAGKGIENFVGDDVGRQGGEIHGRGSAFEGGGEVGEVVLLPSERDGEGIKSDVVE